MNDNLSFDTAKQMSQQELELNCYKTLYQIYKRAFNNSILRHSKDVNTDTDDKTKDDIAMSLAMSELDRDKVRFINDLLSKQDESHD